VKKILEDGKESDKIPENEISYLVFLGKISD
jgi:hypothetical protein